MRRNVSVMCAMSLLVLGTWAGAGEVTSAEHAFNMTWPAAWERKPPSQASGNTVLTIIDKKTDATFQIAVVPGVQLPEEFLKTDKILPPDLQGEGRKRIRHDALGTVGGRLCRQLIFAGDDKLVHGVAQVIAHQRLYLLTCSAWDVPVAAFKAMFEGLLGRFKVTDASPEPPRGAGSPAPASPASAAPDSGFGSDF
ncbi:MAG: hypothetical protein GX442_12805 [Candidatus Riflebacteria bacterium]|nr:hypothetical protein [Candidatus Riflebacteria bacterium]